MEPMFPQEGREPKHMDDRQALNGIFYIFLQVRHGEICRSNMNLTRWFKIASCIQISWGVRAEI